MRNLKKFAAVAAATMLALSACSNGDGDGGNAGSAEGGSSAGASSDYKACIISDAGGWDDRSFNESAYNGLMAAKDAHGIEYNTAESQSDSDFQPNVDAMVSDGCDMIIGVGFLLKDPLEAAAQANPDLQFGLVDSTFSEDTNLENARALVFNTAEAAFLAGYLAAGVTESGTVATFGGMQIPSVTIFMDGFVDGVAYYNEQKGTDVKVLGWDKEAQTGAMTNSFDDQTLGKQQAQQFLDQGADVIMPVAGPVGLGAAAAIQESGDAYFIGVDSDWHETAPDYADFILTSVMKEISASVEDTVAAGVNGKFSAEPYIGTLENGGVGLAPYHDLDAEVSDELKKEIEEISQKIKSGEIVVESPNAP
ncbi:basic membrane protein A [Trueperella bonasi]|uniref:Basic membrane protein A n=1 Tax=Trueperella bonasi TaxID=312286 RepID=A0ABT9NEJ8_9ACTO|nr:BMP family ABC transporter substrate-binding protein [Trueperella bonasi]MDP9805795.1 basic membrane protein A [Trueperella bonasi]